MGGGGDDGKSRSQSSDDRHDPRIHGRDHEICKRGRIMKAMNQGYVIAPQTIVQRLALLLRPPALAHVTISMLLAACTVGRDFTPVSPPNVQNLTPHSLPTHID